MGRVQRLLLPAAAQCSHPKRHIGTFVITAGRRKSAGYYRERTVPYRMTAAWSADEEMMQLFRCALTILMAIENQVSVCSKPCRKSQLAGQPDALSRTGTAPPSGRWACSAGPHLICDAGLGQHWRSRVNEPHRELLQLQILHDSRRCSSCMPGQAAVRSWTGSMTSCLLVLVVIVVLLLVIEIKVGHYDRTLRKQATH